VIVVYSSPRRQNPAHPMYDNGTAPKHVDDKQVMPIKKPLDTSQNPLSLFYYHNG